MDSATFQKFRDIVYCHSGIQLNDTKQAMVASRIAKRMRELGLTRSKDYLQYLTGNQSSEEISRFLDVISTNVTSFFREKEHFSFLCDTVTKWIENGNKKIRIWSAASSTGEEPYTIAMMLLATVKGTPLDMKILATDISTRVLKKARDGRYETGLMQNIPLNLLDAYFTFDKRNNCYSAKKILKDIIIFRRINLSKPPFPMKGDIDIIFCRNVMIYFNNEVRQNLVSEITRLLRPGGYLITGHAESLTSIKTHMKCIKPSYYQKI